MLLNVSYGVLAIGNLICFILVIAKMFQAGNTGLGVICILLAFCGGLGTIIAFIWGWARAKGLGITNLMIAWSVIFVVSAVLYPVVGPPSFLVLAQ